MILSPYSKGNLGASISTFNEVKRKNLTNDTRTMSQLSCYTDFDSPSLHWKGCLQLRRFAVQMNVHNAR